MHELCVLRDDNSRVESLLISVPSFDEMYYKGIATVLFKKKIRADKDLLLNISLSGGQSLKGDKITSTKRE